MLVSVQCSRYVKEEPYKNASCPVLDCFSSPLELQPNAGGTASSMYLHWFQQIWFNASVNYSYEHD